MQRFMDEWSSWPDPTLEVFDVLRHGDRVAVEFRIQATENQRYVEHNRSAFLTIKDDQIAHHRSVLPGAYAQRAPQRLHRAGKHDRRRSPSPVRVDDAQRRCARMDSAPTPTGVAACAAGQGGSGDAHPGANFVGGRRWSAEEADQKIEETIAYHRERNIGFQWWVNPSDTPADLRERLARHGLVLAGDAAMMARLGLDQLEIPVNPAVQVEVVDGTDETVIDAMIISLRSASIGPTSRSPKAGPA